MEIFNQKRMERCQTIYSEIMENWQKDEFFHVYRQGDRFCSGNYAR